MSVLHTTQQRHRIGMRRKLRRIKNASFPFFPYWFIPLFSLGLLSIFATSCVQSTTQRTTDQALQKIGADWVRPDISGRWVTLRGTPPADANTSAIYSAVKSAQSSTWFGDGIQATRVIEDYDAPAVTAPVETPTDAVINATTPAIETTDHSWQFTRQNNVVTLSGEVEDEAMRKSVVESAQFAANGAQIVDQLTITGRKAIRGYSTTALRGVQTLGRCTSGTAAFDNETFDLRCEAPQADAAALRRLASSPLSFGTIGSIDVLATEEIESCETSLGNLLSDARIEFATGSAVINAASSSLLTSIADEARNCPGTLRIEGHTDNQGSAERNAELSLERANAVRLALISRGLSGARLTTEGFGPSQPVASNNTSLGRARNRRIQFRVVRP
jgi:outer membrane protein OmpA-like peptidoglycan-associated protein